MPSLRPFSSITITIYTVLSFLEGYGSAISSSLFLWEFFQIFLLSKNKERFWGFWRFRVRLKNLKKLSPCDVTMNFETDFPLESAFCTIWKKLSLHCSIFYIFAFSWDQKNLKSKSLIHLCYISQTTNV